MARDERSHEKGFAMVTALLLAALAASLVTAMLTNVDGQISRVKSARLGPKNEKTVREAVDWERRVLREAAYKSGIDASFQGWSKPFDTAALMQYLSTTSDYQRMQFSVLITDEQSRYNLNNLASNGMVNLDELAVFQRLLLALHLPVALAKKIAGEIVASQTPLSNLLQTGGAGSPKKLPLLYLNDLQVVDGITPEVLNRLEKFVTLLPVSDAVVPINANTASAEVLAARLSTLTLIEAKRLVEQREELPFLDLNSFKARLKKLFGDKDFAEAVQLSFSSRHFLLKNNIVLDKTRLSFSVLIQRAANRYDDRVLWIHDN